jgi:hypothetical protein
MGIGMELPHKLKIDLPYDSAIPLLGIYQRSVNQYTKEIPP